MTPAQLVALDAMRSAWDEATVQRMLAADALLGALRFAAWEYGRDMNIDAPAIFKTVDTALRAAGHGGVWEARGEEWQSVVETHRDSRVEQRGGLTVRADAPRCAHCGDKSPAVHSCRACQGTGLASLDDVRDDA